MGLNWRSPWSARCLDAVGTHNYSINFDIYEHRVQLNASFWFQSSTKCVKCLPMWENLLVAHKGSTLWVSFTTHDTRYDVSALNDQMHKKSCHLEADWKAMIYFVNASGVRMEMKWWKLLQPINFILRRKFKMSC